MLLNCVQSFAFQLFILMFVMINIGTIAIEFISGATPFTESVSVFVLLLFTVESCLAIYAQGVKPYFKSLINIVDTFVIGASYAMYFIDERTILKALTLVRTVRVMYVVLPSQHTCCLVVIRPRTIG